MEANSIEIKPFFLVCLVIFGIEAIMNAAIAFEMTSLIHSLFIRRMVELPLVLLMIHGYGHGLSSIGIIQGQWLAGIKKGLIWSGCFGVVVLIGFVILFLSGKNPFQIFGMRIPKESMFLYISLSLIIGPITEEIFFRGVLYGFLRRWGVAIAVIGSTLIFAFGHGKALPFTQIVGGLLFTVSYEMERNLLVPITIHIVGNSAIFGLSFLTGKLMMGT